MSWVFFINLQKSSVCFAAQIPLRLLCHLHPLVTASETSVLNPASMPMPLAIYIHLKVSKWGPNKIYNQMQSLHFQIAEWSSEGHYSTSCVSTRRRIFRIVGCFNQSVFKSLEKARLSDLPVSVCGSKLFKTVDQADLIFTEQWRPLDWNRGSNDAWYAPGFGTGVHLC